MAEGFSAPCPIVETSGDALTQRLVRRVFSASGRPVRGSTLFVPCLQVLGHTKRWIDSQAAAAESVSARRRAGEADRWAKKMAWFEQTAAAVSPA